LFGFWQNLNTKNVQLGSVSLLDFFGVIWSFFQHYSGELLVTILGMVIVEVTLYHYFGSREKPRIVIVLAHSKDHRVGFGVRVEKKTVKHTMFICNNRKCA
jgi:hypothetical protein